MLYKIAQFALQLCRRINFRLFAEIEACSIVLGHDCPGSSTVGGLVRVLAENKENPCDSRNPRDRNIKSLEKKSWGIVSERVLSHLASKVDIN